MRARPPAISQVHTIDRGWKRRGLATQIREEWRLLRRVASRRYDLLVHLTEHPRGLTLALLLHPRWSVTRERAKSTRLSSRVWRRRFTHFYRQPAAPTRHTVEANLDALRRIGIYPDPSDKRLVLVPGRDAQAKATALLAQHGLAARGFIQVHPGSRWLFKCWPADPPAALIARTADDGFSAAIPGAPDERERALVAAILAEIKPAARARTVD